MAIDVIMPALGMAQDTGKLVSWLMNIGDAVNEADILMEVETDKTTMEVPAGAKANMVHPMATLMPLMGPAGTDM